MEINAEITFTLPGEVDSYSGQCRNLSHSGIMFITEKALPEGESLEVTIDTRSDKFKPMKALVEIIRVEPREDNQYETAGIIKEYK
jgi:hypothetical protein